MVGIVTNTYTSPYSPQGAFAERNTQSGANASAQNPSYASATNVTLSQAAQDALANEAKTSSAVTGEAVLRKLTNLLDLTGRDSLLDGDDLSVDLSSFSRQEIFTIFSNSGNLFTAEEQKAAEIELEQRFDTALGGGYALMGVTGNIGDLYEKALEYMQHAGADEKKTTAWQTQFNALTQAISILDKNPGAAPQGISNDPVADYLERLADGLVSGKSNLEAVATEARRVLDGASGLEGLSDFGSKALSAIAVGMSGQFSSSEIIAAKQEMKSRIGASVQDAFQQSNVSGNPTDFSKRLIAQYSSMSAEAREAAGLDQSYYDAIVKNYETSMRISQALGASTFTAGTASGSSNGSMSLLNFL